MPPVGTTLIGAPSSTLQFEVDETTRETDEKGWPYTAYRITTTYQGRTFTVFRRFREVRDLHEQLKPFCPGLPAIFPMWPNVFNRFAADVVDGRKSRIAEYLRQVMSALRGNPVPTVLRAFLQLPAAEETEAADSAGPMLPQSQLEPTDTVILVAYQLPLIVHRADNGWHVEWDEDSVLNKHGLNLQMRVLWVGCVSATVHKSEQEGLSDLLYEQFNCVPVFLDEELTSDFYHGFCRSYLRPILHNQLPLPTENNPFSDKRWRAYCTANRKFAEKVMEVYEPGYMVWVHDYHLILLPSYILRRHHTAHIGLFLHSPFPASDVFRSIAMREELLRAMLNADLIGFLLFEYTRNFLTSCKRLLGLEYEFKRGGFLGVEYGGRHVMVQVSTFGVSPSQLSLHLHADAQARAASELTAMSNAVAKKATPRGAPVVLAAVDYLDRFKGVQLKLLAWEALLKNYPKYQTGYVLVQILVASRNQMKLVTDAQLVREEIELIAKRINETYPGTVYLEEKTNLSTAGRVALWLRSAVIVYTAVREAVNAHPLEYIMARSLANVPAGVTIMSEFSGFSRVLNGTLQINPWNEGQLQAALDQALQMHSVEIEGRAKKNLEHITTNTAEDWARRFLIDLKSMVRKPEEHWMAVGFGLASFRMVGMGIDFKALDTQQVLLSYRQATQRVVLLDWGGTLSPADTAFYDMREQSLYELPESVLSALRILCADPANHVMIISGLGRDKVQAAFGSVPNLSLAVEHGFSYRIKGGQWVQLLPGVDTSWREIAEAIMAVYTTRTNGSFIQRKGSSVTWNHQNADPEFGAMQARELQYHLQGVLAAFPVVVRIGKGYVEACPKGIDKGIMAERFLDVVQSADPRRAQPVEFVLCIGDDSSDELMFSALHNKFGQRPADVDLYTATVGRKPSCATAYMGDHTDVVELLKMLSSLNNSQNKRFASMGDLTSLEHSFGGVDGGRAARGTKHGLAARTRSIANTNDARGRAPLLRQADSLDMLPRGRSMNLA